MVLQLNVGEYVVANFKANPNKGWLFLLKLFIEMAHDLEKEMIKVVNLTKKQMYKLILKLPVLQSILVLSLTFNTSIDHFHLY